MADYSPEERKAARDYLEKNAPSGYGCVAFLIIVAALALRLWASTW